MPAGTAWLQAAVGMGGAKTNSQRTGAMVRQAQGRVNDGDLIRAAQRGDRVAFEMLVRQYDHAVLRLALHLTGSESDRKSTRLNSSHANISYAVFCLKKKNEQRGGLP